MYTSAVQCHEGWIAQWLKSLSCGDPGLTPAPVIRTSRKKLFKCCCFFVFFFRWGLTNISFLAPEKKKTTVCSLTFFRQFQTCWEFILISPFHLKLCVVVSSPGVKTKQGVRGKLNRQPHTLQSGFHLPKLTALIHCDFSYPCLVPWRPQPKKPTIMQPSVAA